MRGWARSRSGRISPGILPSGRYGHGTSETLAEKRPVEYLHREGEVVLPALLAALGIGRPILLGHSDGASIALIYAGAVPDGPRALILEAPHVFVEELTVASIARVKTAFETTDLSRKLGRFHTDAAITFWGWNDIWLDPRFRTWNIERYLPSIRCPTLLIQGEDDEYGTAEQLVAIRRQVPDAEMVMLPHCRHSPHRDQAEATLERVAAFVAALPPA
jgi:pimeloyl-ACP methyl ester carboxylesterase